MAFDKSWFILPYEKLKPIQGFDDSDVRFPAKLAEKFILEYSKEGNVVFDPFAGFGTTLMVAEQLNRVGLGIEYDEKKVAYIKSKLKDPSKIMYGSSLALASFDLPQIDLSFTSPPYMRSFDVENPLSSYTEKGNYEDYLAGIDDIYSQIKKITKKGGVIVVEVSNTFDKDHQMTTLAWDVGKIIAKHFHFERDFIFCFENGEIHSSSDNDVHSYCLVYKNI